MPLGSYAILQKLRGSTDGTPPFDAGSLGAYIETNFATLGSAKSFQIECFQQTIQQLASRNLEPFRIGIYESPSQNRMLIEDDRPDLITQPYTISIFKRMARAKGYSEEEENHVFELKDAIIEWATRNAEVSRITLDSNSEASLLTFTYITTNTITRDDVQKYVYLEMQFNALRQI